MSIRPGGRSIAQVAATKFMLLAPEEIDRQTWRRAVDDIVPTTCLQRRRPQSAAASRAHDHRALSVTMSMAQMAWRPANCRYRNAMIQLSALGMAFPSRIWGDILCDRHSGFAVPSAVAILSTVLLCSASGTAMSQSTTGSLPASRRLGRSSEAVARPTVVVTETGARTVNRPPSDIRPVNRSNAVVRAGFTIGAACQAGESRQQLQRWLRNKFPVGKEPWVGCSEAGAGETSGHFSSTCRDTMTYNTTRSASTPRLPRARHRRKLRWLCSSLQADRQVSRRKSSRRNQAIGPPLVYGYARDTGSHGSRDFEPCAMPVRIRAQVPTVRVGQPAIKPSAAPAHRA